MITKDKLKLGDILITDHSDPRFKYYIYCYTRIGFRFISRYGTMSMNHYDNSLCCVNHSEWDIKKVFRPSKKYAHTKQTDIRGFIDKLKFPFADMLASSIDITDIDKIFIDLRYYV